MLALLFTVATGALAAPGHGAPPPPHVPPPPPPPPTNQNTNTNNNWQSNSCGNGASPYCCSATADGLGENYWKCSDLNDVCNDVIVCCNNNSNNNNQQVCPTTSSIQTNYAAATACIDVHKSSPCETSPLTANRESKTTSTPATSLAVPSDNRRSSTSKLACGGSKSAMAILFACILAL